MANVWILPKTYTAGQLVTAYRFVKANPEAIFQVDDGWSNARLTSADWLRWFRGCLAEKIASHLPLNGRKDDYSWWCDAQRLARKVNTRTFLLESEAPREFRARLRHRFNVVD